MNDRQYEEAYAIARQRVNARIGFYKHVLIYLLVNIPLLVIDLVGSPDRLWFYWPLMGWGVALCVHGLRVFLFSGVKNTPQEISETDRPKKK